MRRLFQFRLRALFVLVTLAAIAALWWSHRLHCLDRAAFHRTEIVRCQEQQVRDTDEFVLAYARQRNPQRRPPRDLLREVLLQQLADEQRELDTARAKSEKQLAEFKATIEKMELRRSFDLQGTPRSKRWEDQTVYDSMAQGFLVVPAPGAERSSPPSTDSSLSIPDVLVDPIVKAPEPPRAVEKELDEPDLVTIYETHTAALAREVEIHTELAAQFQRAVYRPWMRIDESVLTESSKR
jgi:hypothetical protein